MTKEFRSHLSCFFALYCLKIKIEFQYIREKERILYLNDISPNEGSSIATIGGFFGTSPKARRQGEVIQKLAEMIGSNVKL